MSGTKEEGKRTIPRFKGSADSYTSSIYFRYIMNADQIIFVITDQRLLGIKSSAEAHRRWDDAHRKARSHIVQNLGTQPIVAVSEILERIQCSALEVWTKLKATYQKNNIQTYMSLRQLLNSLVFKDDGNILEHLHDMDTIFIELARLGDALTEKQRTACVLQTLPDSLMALADSIEHDQGASMIRSKIDLCKNRDFASTIKLAGSQNGVQ